MLIQNRGTLQFANPYLLTTSSEVDLRPVRAAVTFGVALLTVG